MRKKEFAIIHVPLLSKIAVIGDKTEKRYIFSEMYRSIQVKTCACCRNQVHTIVCTRTGVLQPFITALHRKLVSFSICHIISLLFAVQYAKYKYIKN